MKNSWLFYTCFFSFFIANSFAQSNIKVGLTYVKFNVDGQQGGEFYMEYNKNLTKAISIAPSFHINYAIKGRDFPYYLINKFSTGIDINLFFAPIRSKQGIIKIGLGPSGRFISGRNRSYYGISENYSGISGLGPDGSYWVPYFFPNDRLRPTYVAIGYSGIIEGELNLSTRIVSGIRFSYQQYSSSERITSTGISIGYRF
jgi:hypothetical protein